MMMMMSRPNCSAQGMPFVARLLLLCYYFQVVLSLLVAIA
jgi:hypothetical protein